MMSKDPCGWWKLVVDMLHENNIGALLLMIWHTCLLTSRTIPTLRGAVVGCWIGGSRLRNIWECLYVLAMAEDPVDRAFNVIVLKQYWKCEHDKMCNSHCPQQIPMLVLPRIWHAQECSGTNERLTFRRFPNFVDVGAVTFGDTRKR